MASESSSARASFHVAKSAGAIDTEAREKSRTAKRDTRGVRRKSKGKGLNIELGLALAFDLRLHLGLHERQDRVVQAYTKERASDMEEWAGLRGGVGGCSRTLGDLAVAQKARGRTRTRVSTENAELGRAVRGGGRWPLTQGPPASAHTNARGVRRQPRLARA